MLPPSKCHLLSAQLRGIILEPQFFETEDFPSLDYLLMNWKWKHLIQFAQDCLKIDMKVLKNFCLC